MTRVGQSAQTSSRCRASLLNREHRHARLQIGRGKWQGRPWPVEGGSSRCWDACMRCKGSRCRRRRVSSSIRDMLYLVPVGHRTSPEKRFGSVQCLGERARRLAAWCTVQIVSRRRNRRNPKADLGAISEGLLCPHAIGRGESARHSMLERGRSAS